ncbi:MAG: LPS-assembly protein LptD [Campylobacterota bacterium]|nr:LPS-assembly protein LptD [Campylobacterota bacterium]
MHKSFILIFLFIVSIINAATFSDDEYLQIVAKDLNSKNDIITANGNVIAYSPAFYITAKKLIYDKNNLKLELFGDVNIIKNNETVSFSQYLFIDLKNELKNIKPMLLLDKKAKLWFNASVGNSNQDNFKLENSTLSSCDCKDPSWSLSFSSGDYNTTNQWVNTYNTTLYIKEFPILYTPYFGFPTDDTRRTGILQPTIGFSKEEGWIYAQPIYFAPKENYDIEYIPQTRLKRGSGHALKYRYVDSLYSKLTFEMGTFKENEEYRDEMNLENSSHHGWDLEYSRTKLFSKNNDIDGLIIKSIDMNDVDYINTKYDSEITNYTNRFLESQIKYFYNTNQYYTDIDARFYNDISKENNDDVMQDIPTVNLHKYSNSFLFNTLSYSVDIETTRKSRKTGLNADKTDIYIPISYHQYLFNNYINLSLSEQVNYTNINYKNDNGIYEDVNYGTNNHVISLYTDLIKPYDNYLHSIGLSAIYTKPDDFKQTGDIYNPNLKPSTSKNDNLSIFPIAKSTKSISFGVNQSIYNRDNLKELINHKMNQVYVYNEDENKYIKNDLENDLSLFYDYGSLSNRFIYNYDINKITSSSTTFKFLKDSYFTNVYYSYLVDKNDLDKQRNINYDLGFGFSKYYKVSYKEDYDLTNSLSKKKEYMFNIDKKCWAINFKLIDSLIATNTTDNTILRQNIVYMEFNLKQLFQTTKRYTFKERRE